MNTIPTIETLRGGQFLQNWIRKRRYRALDRLFGEQIVGAKRPRQVPAEICRFRFRYRATLVAASLVCVLLIGISIDFYFSA